jgi:Zn-dependent protease with chaperone function
MPDFRLRLSGDLPPDLALHLPAPVIYGRWIDRLGLGRAAIATGIVSAAMVALFMTAPQWLGPMIPLTWERRIGDAIVGDLGKRLCATPDSELALAKLTSAIDAEGGQIRVGIANISLVNAVALPGSQVLLFDGIVQQAESPEELAGVLAHEIGHVRERHVMSALLRQFGLTVLLSGANSGAANSAFGLASLSYSRAAERQADAIGRRLLAGADISPLGTAGFFDRVAKEFGETAGGTVASNSDGEGKRQGGIEEMTGWLASHPASHERAAEYRAAARPRGAYRPPLRAQEFAALKRACTEDKDVKDFDLF